jgi:sec-independent protein translocase protein TatA
MGLSPTHLIIFAIIALLMFGSGRFSSMMVDVAKGVKGFKKSMAEEDDADVRPVARLQSHPAEPAPVREPTTERAAV